jgi:hypothetical protein
MNAPGWPLRGGSVSGYRKLQNFTEDKEGNEV